MIDRICIAAILHTIEFFILGDRKMKRREVLKYAAGLATLATLRPAAAGEGLVDFSEELYAEMLESGKPFMVGFLSNW